MSRVVWYMDQELKTARRAEFYDKQGVLAKRMEVERIDLLGDVPFATDMRMTDLGTGHSSRMQMLDLVVDKGVEEVWFTNRALQNGF